MQAEEQAKRKEEVKRRRKEQLGGDNDDDGDEDMLEDAGAEVDGEPGEVTYVTGISDPTPSRTPFAHGHNTTPAH